MNFKFTMVNYFFPQMVGKVNPHQDVIKNQAALGKQITAIGVNKAFVIAFPIAFVLFISYMTICIMLYPKGMKIPKI